MSNGKILGQSMVLAGWDAAIAGEQAFDEALKKAGLKRPDVAKIMATGAGRGEAKFATASATDVACNAKGIVFLHPEVRTVIDVGAEESRAAKCDATGRVVDFAKNDKCAAGVGSFVEAMAKALEINVEEMARISLQSDKEIPVNVTCVVFAESEVVSLIHSGHQKHDIARAINDAIASRTTSMVRRIGVEPEVALIGGTARNIGVQASLKRSLGITNLVVPKEPEFVSAIGAAIIARS